MGRESGGRGCTAAPGRTVSEFVSSLSGNFLMSWVGFGAAMEGMSCMRGVLVAVASLTQDAPEKVRDRGTSYPSRD